MRTCPLCNRIGSWQGKWCPHCQRNQASVGKIKHNTNKNDLSFKIYNLFLVHRELNFAMILELLKYEVKGKGVRKSINRLLEKRLIEPVPLLSDYYRIRSDR